jgi:hypothetical protein
MVSAAYYRKEAERCRALALATDDAEAALRWNRIADDYTALAEAVATEEAKEGASKLLHVPMQQGAQPIQQQQGKLGTDEPTER